MKTFFATCLGISVVVCSSSGQEAELSALPNAITIDDFTYQNVQWGRTQACVMILHKGGTAYLPLAKLPAAIRNRLASPPEAQPAPATTTSTATTAALKQDLPAKIAEPAPTEFRSPVMGDETLIAEVISDPAKWQGKSFIASGLAKTNNIFLYGSAFNPDTHYSLGFEQIAADKKSDTLLTVYVSQQTGAPLIAALSEAVPVRLKLQITPRCFQFGQYQLRAELVDWQLLKDDRKTWGNWALGAP